MDDGMVERPAVESSKLRGGPFSHKRSVSVIYCQGYLSLIARRSPTPLWRPRLSGPTNSGCFGKVREHRFVEPSTGFDRFWEGSTWFFLLLSFSMFFVFFFLFIFSFFLFFSNAC